MWERERIACRRSWEHENIRTWNYVVAIWGWISYEVTYGQIKLYALLYDTWCLSMYFELDIYNGINIVANIFGLYICTEIYVNTAIDILIYTKKFAVGNLIIQQLEKWMKKFLMFCPHFCLLNHGLLYKFVIILISSLIWFLRNVTFFPDYHQNIICNLSSNGIIFP